MKRLTLIPLALALASCLGCVTERDRVALVRTEKVLAAIDTDQARASREEVRQVGLDVGADRIDPVGVEVTPQAANDNARGIAEERGARAAIWEASGGLLKDLFSSLPYGATAGGLAMALWQWLKRGKVQKVAKALSIVLDASKNGSYQDGMTQATLEKTGADPGLANEIRSALP